MSFRPACRRPLLGLVVVSLVLAACRAKEQAKSPEAVPPTSVVTTTTTTTTLPPPPAVWRSARWGMTKAEVLAAFPGEAQHLAKPADFGQPTPGGSDVAIPAYESDGTTFRVLFGFGPDGLSRIQLSAAKPSASACEDLEKRLIAEHAKPSSRGDTGTSLRGEQITWTVPGQTITLACAEKPSLGFRSVALDYVVAASK